MSRWNAEGPTRILSFSLSNCKTAKTLRFHVIAADRITRTLSNPSSALKVQNLVHANSFYDEVRLKTNLQHPLLEPPNKHMKMLQVAEVQGWWKLKTEPFSIKKWMIHSNSSTTPKMPTFVTEIWFYANYIKWFSYVNNILYIK